ncbi:MAG: hypothetical protein E4G90_08850 [Gemmatimonadales bacterium]|nr:MAG: hypothetical protein E4G90_08850 [Gemmatimonadales bacterium]
MDAFPGIEPFDGLGQLRPDQLASLYDQRKSVTAVQFQFAEVVDRAFALQDMTSFAEILQHYDAPLPWVPAAVKRWLEEQPDAVSGLGKLERLALDAMRVGCETPVEVFASVAKNDTHPQYWGDTTLWGKLNALAYRDPPLIRIEGPGGKLPQWGGSIDDRAYRLHLV